MRPDQPTDRLAIDQQVDVLHGVLGQSPLFIEVLRRARGLGLPGWYLAAGCVTQTVWNVLGSRPPEEGIRDYDLPYFEPSDLSWEAEDTAIQAAEQTFVGLPVAVEVRNEARVHLWYEAHFGVQCPPYSSTEAAIARSRRPRPVWGSGSRRLTTGASTRLSDSPISSAWSSAPTRPWPPGTSARRRCPGGAGSGRAFGSCPGRR